MGPNVPQTLMPATADESPAKEIAFRDGDALFCSAFEHTHVAMVVTDLDNRFVRSNAAFARLFGYSQDEILRLSMGEITHPDDVSESYARRESLLAGAFEFFQVEKRYIHREGHTFWGLTNVSLIRDAGGRPALYMGQVQDITERKWAESRIRESEARYRSVVEGSMQGIVIHQDGLIRHVNAAFCRMFCYDDPSELIGRDWTSLVAPKELSELQSRADASLAGHRVKPHAGWQGIRKDGKKVWFESIVSRMNWNGRPAAVASLIDITERKSLEEQFRHAQKMDAVGRLAGGVAHDFNNLLTVIIGYGELVLGDDSQTPDSRELIREIVRAGERAASLTRQLLAFSHKQVLVPVVLDLNALLSEMEKMLVRLIGDDVVLQFVGDPDLGRVKVDPGQLEQVVMNLAVNARDAMPRGGRITVETANVELDEEYAATHLGLLPGPHVLLAVSDTGCGMDAETVSKIFEPFFTTKGPDRGTGLGLSIVHGIVKQSGGRIEVYSEVGTGTTFKIYLPRCDDVAVEARARPQLATAHRGTETVLLVDDDAAVRELARHVLEKYGYRVLVAGEGNEALEIGRRHDGEISLLVSDLVMPNMGGQQLASRLAALRPGLRVLFLSGYADDAVVLHGMITPDTPFLQKPFSPDSLAAMVRHVLES